LIRLQPHPRLVSPFQQYYWFTSTREERAQRCLAQASGSRCSPQGGKTRPLLRQGTPSNGVSWPLLAPFRFSDFDVLPWPTAKSKRRIEAMPYNRGAFTVPKDSISLPRTIPVSAARKPLPAGRPTRLIHRATGDVGSSRTVSSSPW